jgi:hypothetical protein
MLAFEIAGFISPIITITTAARAGSSSQTDLHPAPVLEEQRVDERVTVDHRPCLPRGEHTAIISKGDSGHRWMVSSEGRRYLVGRCVLLQVLAKGGHEVE